MARREPVISNAMRTELAAARKSIKARRAEADHQAKRLQRALADLRCARGNLEEAAAGVLALADLDALIANVKAQGLQRARSSNGWTDADLVEAGFVDG